MLPHADMFKTLDWERVHAGMSQPAFVFDGRNILDHKLLREIGFEVYAIGHPGETADAEVGARRGSFFGRSH